MILDTNAVSALLGGDEALSTLLGSDHRHHLPAVVVGEYRYGLQRSKFRSLLESLLADLIRYSIVLPVDEETATAYSTVREELRKKGRPIPENDIWIAALARQHRLPVVTRDRHFDDVPGMSRRGW